jgi:hypothetical protein
VAFTITSVTGEIESLTLSTGDWAVGAVTFRLEPSAFKSAVVAVVAVGEAGVGDCLLQATAMANVHAGTKTNLSVRAIDQISKDKP